MAVRAGIRGGFAVRYPFMVEYLTCHATRAADMAAFAAFVNKLCRGRDTTPGAAFVRCACVRSVADAGALVVVSA